LHTIRWGLDVAEGAIRVFIADDHAIVREGLKQIVADTPDMQVAGEACDGLEAVERVLAGEFDVVVLDISMPGQSGLSALAEIKKARPQQHVLVLSIHPEVQYAISALKAGADGYLTKESAPVELLGAIRRVAQGGQHVGPAVEERLSRRPSIRAAGPAHDRLSPREYEVMCLIAQGLSIREIGERLGRSIKTIHTHRYRILEKLGLRSNSDLTRYALKLGLVD
jgi:DNA-binding NarL/FixJ family response regulator